jgi:hypothetical protein
MKRRIATTMSLAPQLPRYRLTEAELSNLITACQTSSMRTSESWRTTLDALATKLDAMRSLVGIKNKGTT